MGHMVRKSVMGLLIVGCLYSAFFMKDGPDISMVVGLVALGIALEEMYQSTSPVVSVRRCVHSHVESVNENNRRMFSQFEMLIQNHGMTLYNMKAAITFIDPDTFRSFTYTFKPTTELVADQFSKGLLAEFVIKSYELQGGLIGRLQNLKHPRKQKAYLNIYSQGYIAYRIPLGTYSDKLKSWWNGIAVRVNMKLARTIPRKGEGPMLKYTIELPRFQVLTREILMFVESLIDYNAML